MFHSRTVWILTLSQWATASTWLVIWNVDSIRNHRAIFTWTTRQDLIVRNRPPYWARLLWMSWRIRQFVSFASLCGPNTTLRCYWEVVIGWVVCWLFQNLLWRSTRCTSSLLSWHWHLFTEPESLITRSYLILLFGLHWLVGLQLVISKLLVVKNLRAHDLAKLSATLLY